MSGPAAEEVSALTVVVTSFVVEDEGADVWVIICVVVVVTGATLVSIVLVVGLLAAVSAEAVKTGGAVEVKGEPVLTSSFCVAVVVTEVNRM